MIKVRIITPDGLYKETETTIINVSSMDGQRGILPSHMPIVFMLDIGKLELEIDGKRELFAISGGMLYFENDEATILVNAIESKSDIDQDRANSAMQRAQERIKNKDPNIDLKRAEIALRKALNRIKVANY